MMKHHAKLATGLSALVVLPLLNQEEDRVLLQNAFEDIVASIEVVGRLAEQVPEDPDGARELLLRITEPQSVPDAQLDQRLNDLRHEVSLLQMEMDARLAMQGSGAPIEKRALPPAKRPQVANAAGLTDSLRSVMRRNLRAPEGGTGSPYGSGGPAGAGGSGASGMLPAQSLPSGAQAGGYSADPVGQARASFYAKRFDEVLRLTQDRSDIPSRYLRSRCLTRLSRFDEAIELLTGILEEAGDSYEGRRAATDIEFVRWKRTFVDALPEGMRRQGAGL